MTPLNKAGVLLDQYRRNLSNWREATNKQYREALEALGLRVLLFAALLAAVFRLAHLWRRAAYRYVHEARRRSRLLLLQRIVLWSLVVAIVASTFVTELGSLATFAGLITAGLAVAMQSVLVSIVGYFFLIGKYGIRVGDRVQIGTRDRRSDRDGAGAPAPDGGVRRRADGPTGRVVAFANSIIFQSSGGLFKQIPGVNLAWHEVTFSLPTGADYAALKDEMVRGGDACDRGLSRGHRAADARNPEGGLLARDGRAATFRAAAVLGRQRRRHRALPRAAVPRGGNRRARIARAAERHLGARQRRRVTHSGVSRPANGCAAAVFLPNTVISAPSRNASALPTRG